MATTTNQDPNDELHWYIALVANNTEKATMDWLVERKDNYPAEGFAEYRLPMMAVDSVNSRGKVVTKMKPAIPRFLFVRTTNIIRYNLSRTPNIKRWVMGSDYTPEGFRKFAIVPDAAMNDFSDTIDRINGNCKTCDPKTMIGKPVKFIGGPLKGKTGILAHEAGKYLFKKTFDSDFLPGISIAVDEDTVNRYIRENTDAKQ